MGREGKPIAMTGLCLSAVRISAVLAAVCFLFAAPSAFAQHACDAAEEGYRVVSSVEIAGVEDGAPYRAGADWVLDRTTTRLPMCELLRRRRQLQPAVLFARSDEDHEARHAVPRRCGGGAVCRPVPAGSDGW